MQLVVIFLNYFCNQEKYERTGYHHSIILLGEKNISFKAINTNYLVKNVTLTCVARGTFADVVVRAHGLEAYPILAVMVLARGGLWVQHRYHWSYLTELASEISCTLTAVVIDTIHTRCTILQGQRKLQSIFENLIQICPLRLEPDYKHIFQFFIITELLTSQLI